MVVVTVITKMLTILTRMIVRVIMWWEKVDGIGNLGRRLAEVG